MNKRKCFTARMEIAGRLAISDRAAFLKACESFGGADFILEIRPPADPRTLDQNAYYRGVVLKRIADETGNDPDDVHAGMKAKFISGSTAKMSRSEFSDYLERCIAFAASELGIEIPAPEETV